MGSGRGKSIFEQKDSFKKLLLTIGVGHGERVAVLSENRPAYFAIVLACWELGVVVVPVSTRYPLSRINQVLEQVDCQRVFVSERFSSLDIEAEKLLIADQAMDDPSGSECITFEDLDIDLDVDASIIFTSGSGCEPKGVLHTVSNHYFSAAGSDENIPFGKGDCWLMSLPMYHISGFSLIMRSLLHGGSIAFPKPDGSLIGSIAELGASHLSLVPVQLGRLIREPECVDKLRGLKAILIGGSAVSSKLVREALKADLSVYLSYGSTEMGSQIATSAKLKLADLKDCSTRVLTHRKVKIAGDGEICVKGETLFRGYVDGESLILPFDDEGYFHTGDIGKLSNDGGLIVVGRKDLMFISGGENIYPEEIEREILDLEDVEAVMVAVSDCEEFGSRSVAFVKMQADVKMDADSIRKHLEGKIERFKMPAAFVDWPKDQPVMKPSRQHFQELAGKLAF